MNINPCPFCGGTPKLIQRTHPAIAHVALAWVVQCTGCTAETCSEHRQWSIDYWNRRAQPSAPVQPVALPPVYKFLLSHMMRWVPLLDAKSNPPLNTWVIMEGLIERTGEHVHFDAMLKTPDFSKGPPFWVAMPNGGAESPWKPLRWLKKVEDSIGDAFEQTASPSAQPQPEEAVEAAHDVTSLNAGPRVIAMFRHRRGRAWLPGDFFTYEDALNKLPRSEQDIDIVKLYSDMPDNHKSTQEMALQAANRIQEYWFIKDSHGRHASKQEIADAILCHMAAPEPSVAAEAAHDMSERTHKLIKLLQAGFGESCTLSDIEMSWAQGWLFAIDKAVDAFTKAAHPGIVPGWVRCSERMPNGVDWFCEPIDSVVVASFTETGFCLFWRKARYVVTKEGVRYADEGWYDGDEKLTQPTHWMPLPAAPKGQP